MDLGKRRGCHNTRPSFIHPSLKKYYSAWGRRDLHQSMGVGSPILEGEGKKPYVNDVEFLWIRRRWHMESEGAITACFYVQITRFFIWEIVVQRASFRFILRANVGKKISLSLSIFFLLAVLPSCWNWCFHPLVFFPSFLHFYSLRHGFVFIYRLFWKEKKVVHTACCCCCWPAEVRGRDWKWVIGLTGVLFHSTDSPIHLFTRRRNAQVELQLSPRHHVFSSLIRFFLPVRMRNLISIYSGSSAQSDIPRNETT